MDRRTFRLVMIGLSLLLVAVVALAVAFNPGTGERALPDQVVAVTPAPDSAVLPQTDVEVVMQPGYAIELTVDGLRVPPGEVGFIEATGRYTWAPGPGRVLEGWLPGEHRVAITWDRVVGLPDQGSFAWSFRVQ